MGFGVLGFRGSGFRVWGSPRRCNRGTHLTQASCAVGARRSDGATPLLLAAQQGHTEARSHHEIASRLVLMPGFLNRGSSLRRPPGPVI